MFLVSTQFFFFGLCLCVWPGVCVFVVAPIPVLYIFFALLAPAHAQFPPVQSTQIRNWLSLSLSGCSCIISNSLSTARNEIVNQHRATFWSFHLASRNVYKQKASKKNLRKNEKIVPKNLSFASKQYFMLIFSAFSIWLLRLIFFGIFFSGLTASADLDGVCLWR